MEGPRRPAFTGVAQTAVLSAILPRTIRIDRPPSPVPCLLVGQFATDRSWAGRGIGTALLAHALGAA